MPTAADYPQAAKNPAYKPVRLRLQMNSGIVDLTIDEALRLRDQINTTLTDLATEVNALSTQVAPPHPRCPAHGVFCTGDDCCCAQTHKEEK